MDYFPTVGPHHEVSLDLGVLLQLLTQFEGCKDGIVGRLDDVGRTGQGAVDAESGAGGGKVFTLSTSPALLLAET